MTREDEEHLRLLSIFHYVVAGVAALFACLPFLHFAFGVLMLSGAIPAEDPGGERIVRIIGLFMIGISSIVILLGFAFAVALAISGSYLQKRTHYSFCLVMAAIACIFMPFGTVLGVFTILVLMRPSVKAAFLSVSQFPVSTEPPEGRCPH